MRRLIAVGVVLAAGAPLVPAAAAACPPWSGKGWPPRCHERTVPVPATVGLGANPVNGRGGVKTVVRVVLPVDYNRNRVKRYPVLFLLHGAGDSYRSWTERTDLIRFSARYPALIVMPEGGCVPVPERPACDGAGWYSDWKDGSRRWETFHIGVLVPWVDANYRTLGARHRGIAGLSMGGFGAMKYAARHSGVFRAAASFSGILDPWYGAPVTGYLYDESSGTIPDQIWGDQLADAPTWWEHDPAMLADKLADVALWLSSGTGEPHEGSPYFDIGENLVFQNNMSFVRAMLAAGRAPQVDYETNFYAGGRHLWPYWEAAMHRALPEIVEVIR